LRFGLDEVEARVQRELALLDLSLMIEGLSSSAPTGMAVSTGMASPAASMGSGAPAMLPGNSAPAAQNKGGMK
jgi:hypothetical protein